jgi:CheY-like chemotaxis protein
MKPRIILSVEDNEISAEYLKIAIQMLGYEMLNFGNAYDGIEYLRNNVVSLVLMDVQLPGINGYEATRIIKKEFPEIPVVIITANALKGDMEKAFESGCDDYIPKPVSLMILKEKIARILGPGNL